MKALVVLPTLLTAILLSGNCMCVGGVCGWGGGDREEGRAYVFGLGYYLPNLQE